MVEAAFANLQQESFKIFFSNMMEIKEQAARITFKTAADIAAQMVIGQTRDIFAKMDPLNVGEDYRSNLIAEQYAIRLNLRANNLVQSPRADGLDILLRHVSAPSGKVAELAQILVSDVIIPRHAVRKEPLKLEYLNAESIRIAKAKSLAKGRWAARF